ncbi:MAG: hypothetical protein KTR33_00095 [Gammaproteobacteria bacterium]|nr:hypothetical protein [Gammaproteobacteria bacterium]
MRHLLNIWLSIAFLMGKPSDYPADRQSLQIAIVAALASFILASSLVVEFSVALTLAGLDVALAGGGLWIALQLAGKPTRFSQAFGAYCGASAVLNVASMIMLNTTDPESAESGLSLAAMLQFVYLVWGISMVAHILRFTFELALPVSILAATGYLILSLTVIGMIFPH